MSDVPEPLNIGLTIFTGKGRDAPYKRLRKYDIYQGGGKPLKFIYRLFVLAHFSSEVTFDCIFSQHSSCITVCTSGGFAVSFWNRPIFPEWCSDPTMDNKTTYNTMVRLSGSWTRLGSAFMALMQHYGWQRAVLVSDTAPGTCLYGVTSINNQLSAPSANFTILWIRLNKFPTAVEMADTLQQIKDRVRSESLSFATEIYYHCFTNLISI